MPNKTQEYLNLAQQTAKELTRYWENWTDYLTTASRLYKYNFADQLMIYAQRPDATACASFDIWSNRMNRYVRRGSKGIALLDQSSSVPRLHYVFDVSDTGVRRNSRDPEVWQLGPDLVQPVSEMLAREYGVSHERFSQQISDLAGKLVDSYWDNNSGDILDIVDGSFLMDYDEAGQEFQFKSAAAISITYAVLERCGFEPEGHFDRDDFQTIFSFSTPAAVYALGTAVSECSRELLRSIERTVKTTIRRRNVERSQYEYEQQERDLLESRRLSASEPDPAPAGESIGQVRATAPDLPDEASPGTVQFDAPVGNSASAPVGSGAERGEPDTADHAEAAGAESGSEQRAASDGVGAAHEQPERTGRGTGDERADLQLSFFDTHIPTEAKQIESIDQAESEKSPSAFSLSQADIENALRRGSNFENSKLRIWKIYQLQPDRNLRAKALAKEYAPNGPGGSSHTYLDGSRGWLDHDSKGLTFEHYPDHQKILLRWNQVEKYIDLMIQSDRYLSDKEKRIIDFPLELNDTSAAEYTALKEQYPDTFIGFEAGGNFMFYGEDAAKVAKIINSALFMRNTALGEVQITGFLPSLWAKRAKELWSAGNDVYLAGLNEDGTHHQTKHLRKEDYLPIGSVINMDGRKFRVDSVDFDKDKVSLQDMALADARMPIFREEPLTVVRELYEQQDEALDTAPEKTPDYNVGDSVVVDLPTRTIEGTIGYVGETDVRIDTSAQGYSWSNEVLNKQQFEDGLRQDEPELSDEELDKLPTSVEVNGEWQTFPDAAAADKALNAEPVPEAAGNFHITDDHLGEGGAKQKYARNVEAIRTLFQLEQEHRGATAEEQQVLSQYVGWGGLPDAFDPDKGNWAKEYSELKGLLSEDEYAAARSSVLNAHYTSPTVIRAIYDAVEKMGFRNGNILEPSMGIGNFFGMLPDTMQDSRLYGVELDSVTGRIAQKLYPDANIKVTGFETTDRRDFYDLAVGNVPFGQYRVNDKAYNKLGFSIHNYFFAKAIDQVRPGGIVAFVTSRYTLDSKDSSARKHIAERADLLGAIRLPNTAFKANAGTEVVSDIIFLQKRDRPIDHEPDWVQLGKTEPKKKPRYYKLIANVLVNGKIERRYGRFDFDPTELKNARARNAAANAAAAEFERQEQEKADREASNAGKTFAVVAQEYIESNRSRMAPSVRLKGDYDSNRNKENTSLKKEKYLQRIQRYPEFSEKPIALITKKDCDTIIRFIEDSDARVYEHAVLKPEAKEFKTMSCPKIAKKCTIREETIERIFRGETVSLDSAQQVASALGKTVEQMFEVEVDRRPMTKKTMREYSLFIRSVLNYANDNYGTLLQMPMIKASGRKSKSVDCLHSDEVEALQMALKECSMLEKAIILCLLNTGVRRGELAGLTWKDVNFREGTIHVSKSLLVFPNYGYQLTTTKESNIRDIDVAPEFMAFLKDYHEQWKSRKKLMGASWQKNLEKKGSKYAQSLLDLRGNDFIICNDYGFPINPDSYAALVRRVGKKAGIEKIHPHMFRHTFVSILLSNPNIGVATVAAEAGHAQPSTTLAIYTQVYDRRRDEIRKQMSMELYK